MTARNGEHDEDDVEMEGSPNDDHVEQQSLQLSLNATEPLSRIRTSDSLLRRPQQQQDTGMIDQEQQPHFAPLTAQQASNRAEYRRVRCPPHRYTPLREHWEQILTPLVEYLKLQVRCFFDVLLCVACVVLCAMCCVAPSVCLLYKG